MEWDNLTIGARRGRPGIPDDPRIEGSPALAPAIAIFSYPTCASTAPAISIPISNTQNSRPRIADTNQTTRGPMPEDHTISPASHDEPRFSERDIDKALSIVHARADDDDITEEYMAGLRDGAMHFHNYLMTEH